MIKPRENRIPIMMSDDELKSIDDWRYSNRIATRSDAIRRLCQTGLSVNAGATSVSSSSEKALRVLFRAVERIGKESKKLPTEERLKTAYLTLLAAMESQIDLHRDIARVFIASETFASRNAEIEQAIEIVAQFRGLLEDGSKQ